MTDATLQHLLTRVEAAVGPDRRLDADISRALGLTYRDDGVLGIGPGDDWPQAEFTNSIDTALALVDRAYPESFGVLQVNNAWNHGAYQNNFGYTLHHPMSSGGSYVQAFAATAPRAILAALLRALLARAEVTP